MKTLSMSNDKLMAFKLEYEHAVSLKQPEFEFEGEMFDTNYAKYMIEYIDSRIKNSKL